MQDGTSFQLDICALKGDPSLLPQLESPPADGAAAALFGGSSLRPSSPEPPPVPVLSHAGATTGVEVHPKCGAEAPAAAVASGPGRGGGVGLGGRGVAHTASAGKASNAVRQGSIQSPIAYNLCS